MPKLILVSESNVNYYDAKKTITAFVIQQDARAFTLYNTWLEIYGGFVLNKK